MNAFAKVQARLSILYFHRILDQPDPVLPTEPAVAEFEQQISWLVRSFNVLPLSAAARHLERRTLPPRAVAITFDDGYADNARNALPVLRKLRVSATFYVSTAFTEGGLMWNDRIIEAVRAWPGPSLNLDQYDLGTYDLDLDRAQIAEQLLTALKYRPFDEREEIASAVLLQSGSPIDRLMMNADQIRELHAAGMEIGGHTHSHPILTALDDAAAHQEIVGNKEILERIIGDRVRTFAYPNGRAGRDYDLRHAAMLKTAGYDAAVTTAAGTARSGHDLFQLPRFASWGRYQATYMARLMRNYFRDPEIAAAGPASPGAP